MGGRSEALTAVLMNIQVLQDVTLYRLLTDDTPETSVNTYTYQKLRRSAGTRRSVEQTGAVRLEAIAVAERSAAA